MNEIEFIKARDDLGAYRKVHFYLSHIVRYFQNLERQHKKPHVDLKIVYSNLPEVFSTVNGKLKEYTETVQTKDSKLWKLVLKNWRLMVLKNLFLCKGWTDPFQWPALSVEDLTACGVEQNIAEIFVNNVNVWSRTHWKVGSTVEAWICDQQCWAVGTILQIENDSGVDRLIIGYDNGTRNIIKKTSKYLRPTVEKREMKKEWCYGLKTIEEDSNEELNEELQFLKDKNADLEEQVAELIVQNEELFAENEDMSNVLEHHLETFERYDCDPELVLDCEERRMQAEANYESLAKKQNEMLKKHKEEMKQMKMKMQKEIDVLKLQLRKSSGSKSHSRAIKRGKTCPNFKSKFARNSENSENNNIQGLRERISHHQQNRRKHRVIKRNPSNNKRRTTALNNTSSSTTMKKLPLEPTSFSYLNVPNKESDDISCSHEETENSVAGAQNSKPSSKTVNEWYSKSPRFRSISAPTKKSSRRFAHDNKHEAGVPVHTYSADASVSPQKTKIEIGKRNDPSQVSDDLAFLASRVTALQDKLKAYHHSHTRSRSISDSRSRSSSSDSEDVGMHDADSAMEDYTLEDIEKHLKSKQQEKQNMLHELELDVQSLKHDFEKEAYNDDKKNQKNGSIPKKKKNKNKNNNVQTIVNKNKKNKNNNNVCKVAGCSCSSSLERKKSPPKRLRNRGQKVKHEEDGDISNTKGTRRGEARKSPAKEKQSSTRETPKGRKIKKTSTSKLISKTLLQTTQQQPPATSRAAGESHKINHKHLVTPPPAEGRSTSGNVKAAVHSHHQPTRRKTANTNTPTRKRPPTLVPTTTATITAGGSITPAGEAFEEMGGGIMKSPRHTEAVPQLVY